MISLCFSQRGKCPIEIKIGLSSFEKTVTKCMDNFAQFESLLNEF